MKLKTLLISLVLAVSIAPVMAQRPALIPPVIRFQDNNGKPLAFGTLQSYQAGTTTPLATYVDSTTGALNTNPVVLDSTGSATVFLGANVYKLVLKNSAGVIQWTADNIAQGMFAATYVTSFTGAQGTTRAGAVTTITGDYTCAQITGAVCTLPPTETLYYQTIKVAGAASPQEPILNFIAGIAGAATNPTITAGGSGYTGAPTVTFSGGTCDVLPTGSANVSTGSITNPVVSSGGSGYTSAPTVVLTGGGGTGAAATAIITGGVVTAITITSGGTGYTSAPAVSFTGSTGSGAAATVTFIPSGAIASLVLNTIGSGCATPPTVAFSGGGGTGASATVTLVPPGISCVDNPTNTSTDCTFVGGSGSGGGGPYTLNDVTSERSGGATYQNTTNSIMYISGSFGTAGSGVGNIAVVEGSSGPTTEVYANQATATVAGGDAGFFAAIMPGFFYAVVPLGAVNQGVRKWIEITGASSGGGCAEGTCLQNNPVGSQTVTQPASTTLGVNNLNNVIELNPATNAYGVSGSIATTTGSITTGTALLTVANATGWKVGMGIALDAGTSGALLVTSVTAISGTTFTLATNALSTVSSGTVWHDDSAAIIAAVAASLSSGFRVVHLGAGQYNMTSGVTDSTGITFYGDGERQTSVYWRNATGTAFTINYADTCTGSDGFPMTFGSVYSDFDLLQASDVTDTTSTGFFIGTGSRSTGCSLGIHTKNVQIQSMGTGMSFTGGQSQGWYQNMNIGRSLVHGIYYDAPAGDGDNFFDSDILGGGTNSGLYIVEADTQEFSNLKILGGNITFAAPSSAPDLINHLRFDNPSLENATTCSVDFGEFGTTQTQFIGGFISYEGSEATCGTAVAGTDYTMIGTNMTGLGVFDRGLSLPTDPTDAVTLSYLQENVGLLASVNTWTATNNFDLGNFNVNLTGAGNFGATSINTGVSFSKTATSSEVSIGIGLTNESAPFGLQVVTTGSATSSSRKITFQTLESGVGSEGILAMNPGGGTVTAPTVAISNNDTEVATTAAVTSGFSSFTANLFSSSNIWTGAENTFNKVQALEGVFTNQIIAQGSAPTMSAGGAAGTSPTCTTITGTNMAGIITCTTGTGATSVGTLALIFFNGTLATVPQGCSLMPRNAATASISATIYTTAPTATAWAIAVGLTAPSDSTAYSWSYNCM